MTPMEADPVDLSEEYRALLRRDWAVRVLDARLQSRDFFIGVDWFNDELVLTVFNEKSDNVGQGEGSTIGVAMFMAARAVYPTLPDTVRAQLGEAP